MGSLHASPSSAFRVDCMSVQVGAKRGMVWATAPEQPLARAWGPLAASLEGSADDVGWAPAHTGEEAVGSKRLSDGSWLSEVDWHLNCVADGLARAAAQVDRIASAHRREVLALWEQVTDVAIWIGQATVLADDFPDPEQPRGSKARHVRDNERLRPRRIRLGSGVQRKRCSEQACHIPPDPGFPSLAEAPGAKRQRRLAGTVCPPGHVVVVRPGRAAARRLEAAHASSVVGAQVARWLATRPQPSVPSAHSPAAERIAAPRALARAREAAAPGGPPP